MQLFVNSNGGDPMSRPCRLLAGLAACTVLLLFGPLTSQATDSAGSKAQTLARGKYLSIASDCAACHTNTGAAKPFAGGLAISSPVGKIYAPNITPSTRGGIGNYTEAQFERVLRHGIRGDGANLYPAMPYGSYAVFTDTDVQALFAYFRESVAPVDEPAPKTDLPFPMNIRMSMKVWNLLFLKSEPFQVDPAQSPEWNRGKYLVTGAAHCAECHTPRGFLMEEKSGSAFAGGPVDGWFAPNVTSDTTSGIGSWSQNELVQYLRSGAVRGKAYAAGSMGEAVERSFQHLTEPDLAAIATFFRTIRPIHATDDTTPRFDVGKAFSPLATLRGAFPVAPSSTVPSAAKLFSGSCATCHSFDGQGSADGYFPSLFRNSAVGANQGMNLIATILSGVNRTTADGQAFMPGFGGQQNSAGDSLSDAQIVLVGNYVLSHFGSGQATISAAQVAQQRNGGRTSLLILLARIALGVGIVIVVALIFFLVRRRRQSFSFDTLDAKLGAVNRV
jgi:mono/diheme cytochrome c family protein